MKAPYARNVLSMVLTEVGKRQIGCLGLATMAVDRFDQEYLLLENGRGEIGSVFRRDGEFYNLVVSPGPRPVAPAQTSLKLAA